MVAALAAARRVPFGAAAAAARADTQKFIFKIQGRLILWLSELAGRRLLVLAAAAAGRRYLGPRRQLLAAVVRAG